MSPPPPSHGPRAASPWEGQEALATAHLSSLWEAPIGIAFLDDGLRYVRVNKTLASINGLPPEAHIGKTVSEVLPVLHSQVTTFLQRVLATGQPLLNVELTGHPPHPSPLRHHYIASYYPVKETGGRLVGLGATVHDVTHWRHAQAALHLRRGEPP